MNKGKIYTKGYFDLDSGTLKSIYSAEKISDVLFKLYKVNSVFDLGCGVGSWLSVFKKKGVSKIHGVDGVWNDTSHLLIPRENFTPLDLENMEGENFGTFDLAVCVEVAEHVREDNAEHLISFLTKTSEVIIFGASIPYQGGTGQGHVNEQWQSYWVDMFKKKGYVAIDCVRPKIWSDKGVWNFYRQNIFLYVRKDSLRKYPELQKEYDKGLYYIDIVAPERYIEMGEDRKVIGKFVPEWLRKYFSNFVRKLARR